MSYLVQERSECHGIGEVSIVGKADSLMELYVNAKL